MTGLTTLDIDIGFLLIFFIYGLAFFSMGLTTLMETVRSPSITAARILRPLTVFGLVHGLHEWLEMLLLIARAFDIFVPAYFDIIRIAMLAFSFASLIAYGIQVFSPPVKLAAKDAIISGTMVALYLVSLVVMGILPSPDWVVPAEIMARYMLATPGALIASLAINYQAGQYASSGHKRLAIHLRWASIGLGLYGLTQLIGPPAQLLMANYLHTDNFLSVMGFPIQATRAALALIITASLIRLTQTLEQERQEELQQAQQDRLIALQEVQQQTQQGHEQRKKLLRRTIILQEEERARISRELHDETAQTLTAFSANLAALNNMLPDELKESQLIDRLNKLTREMSHDIHRLVHDLRPAQLDELGIQSALSYLIDRFESDLGIKTTFTTSGHYNRLDPLIETVLFRVAQEALTNVAKHAETKQTNLNLVIEENQITLTVADQGIGFNSTDEAKGITHFGLVGLRERLTAVEGSLEIASKPGAGTTMIATIPLEELCEPEDEDERKNSLNVG